MRMLATVFFVLLAAQVALLVFAPAQPPRPYQIARLAVALGMIACIVSQVVMQRARRRGSERASGAEDTPG